MHCYTLHTFTGALVAPATMSYDKAAPLHWSEEPNNDHMLSLVKPRGDVIKAGDKFLSNENI